MTQTFDLRPLGIGEILDRAIRLYRHKFPDFVGIIAVVQVPLILLQLLVTVMANASNLQESALPYDEIFPTLLTGFGTGFLGIVLSSILIQGLATAAMTHFIADFYLTRDTSVVESYRKVGHSWKSLLGAVLLAGLITFGLSLLLIIPFIGWVAAPGPLIFIVVCVIPLISPIIVLENQGAASAIRRAWELTRRRFWWVLGFMAVLFLLSLLINSGPAYAMKLASQILLRGQVGYGAQFMIRTAAQSLTTLVIGLLYLPLQLSAVVLVYFDLRGRTESFDLALLSRNEATNEIEAATQMPAAVSPKLITNTELGYLGILSLGGLALFGLLMLLFNAALSAFILATVPAF